MKLSRVTGSVVAAAALATSALAADESKVSASAKLWYQTNKANVDGSPDLFNQPTAVGLAEFDVGLKSKTYSGFSGEANLVVLDTLGLENDVVGNLSNATVANREKDGDILDTQYWASVANVQYVGGKTSAKVGRTTLNTPLLFTEKWNAGYNTFEGAVVTNDDIPKTKITAMYITGHNGTGIDGAGGPGNGMKIPSTTTYNGNMFGFGSKIDNGGQTGPLWTDVTVYDGHNSLWGIGASTKPIDGLAFNAWYYGITHVKDAYWLDLSYTIAGIFIGVQNAGVMGQEGTYADGTAYTATGDGMITAFKLGYTIDRFNVFGAYSFTADNENAPLVANMSTNRKTKIYTQAVVQDGGIIGQRDTTAWKLQGSYKFDTWKLVGFAQNVQQGFQTKGASPFYDSYEFDLIASAKVGKHVNLKTILMHRMYDEQTAKGDSDFNLIRLIAAVKF